jgi:hypothetical protein
MAGAEIRQEYTEPTALVLALVGRILCEVKNSGATEEEAKAAVATTQALLPLIELRSAQRVRIDC